MDSRRTTDGRHHCRNPRPPKVRWAAGFSLVEALLASVILAFVVMAVSQAVLAGHMQTADGLHRRRAVALAEALIDEIIRLPYDDPGGASAPGPEAGESTRAAYDNVDDYHGHSEALGSLTDVGGTALDASDQAFSRAATVSSQNVTVTGFGAAFSGQQIIVTVQDAAGTQWTLEHFVPDPV